MKQSSALVKAIQEQLVEGAALRMLAAEGQAEKLARAARLVAKALRAGRKLLLFGNGGSAADAQHLAAEFVNRMVRNRRALPAIALTTDTSLLTSIANDRSYDLVFARQLEALGQKGDIAWGFSTSGKSPSVLRAFKAAKAAGMFRLGFAGRPGSPMDRETDLCLHVETGTTARVQEIHIAFGHILCEQVDELLFG
jgi:D-sedoheptulose 7-phosphate isomerase